MPVRPAPWQAMQAGIRWLSSPTVAIVRPRWIVAASRVAAPCALNAGRWLREVVGHLAEIAVRQVGDKVVHRRVAPRAVAKRDQLVGQIAGRLAGDARVIAVVGALPVLSMARHAALRPRLDRVDALEGGHRVVLRDGADGAHRAADQDESGHDVDCDGSAWHEAVCVATSLSICLPAHTAGRVGYRGGAKRRTAQTISLPRPTLGSFDRARRPHEEADDTTHSRSCHRPRTGSPDGPSLSGSGARRPGSGERAGRGSRRRRSAREHRPERPQGRPLSRPP